MFTGKLASDGVFERALCEVPMRMLPDDSDSGAAETQIRSPRW